METANKYEDIFDASRIISIPEMNVPRILNWLESPIPGDADPFNAPKIGDCIRSVGLTSIRKIPRVPEPMWGSVKRPPFYGAMVVLEDGRKIRVSFEIDLWIPYDVLVSAFRTHDSTTQTSKFHELYLLASYQYALHSSSVRALEGDLKSALSAAPESLHANIQKRYEEKISDAKLFLHMLKQELNIAENRYSQSIQLDAEEQEMNKNGETTDSTV